MRFALLAFTLLLAGAQPLVASGAAPAPIIRVAKPAFPAPLDALSPSGPLRLSTVSTGPRAPAYTPSRNAPRPGGAGLELGGASLQRVFAQPGTTFVVYGTGVLAGFGPRGAMKYAFDFRAFGFPPRSLLPAAYGPQEVVWARQLGNRLVVQTSHLGYASDSGDRNGYLTALDVRSGRILWRSASLVANADNFLVVSGLLVSGYGFTAERDWLYLVDPADGRVRDRLALPSMAERLSLRDGGIVVRAYDARVIVAVR